MDTKKFKLLLLIAISATLKPAVSNAKLCVITSPYYKMSGSVVQYDLFKKSHEFALKDENFSDFTSSFADTDARLFSLIKSAANSSCDVVVGPYMSRECLIAGPVLANKKKLLVSSTCSHLDMEKYKPYLLTAVPSSEVYNVEIAKQHASDKSKKIIAFYQPSDVFSSSSFETFRSNAKSELIIIQVDSNGNFDYKKYAKELGNTSKVILLLYAVTSSKLLKFMSSRNVDFKKLDMIGSSSWTFFTAPLVPVLPILRRAKSVVVPDVIDHDKLRKSQYFKSFRETFKEEPLGVQAISYDVTRMVIKCLKKNREKIHECLTRTPYSGVTGIIKYENNETFPVRKIYFNSILERLK